MENLTPYAREKEIDAPQHLEVEVASDSYASPVLKRLIEEVRTEELLEANAYNRMHNRHNRSR